MLIKPTSLARAVSQSVVEVVLATVACDIKLLTAHDGNCLAEHVTNALLLGEG